MDSLFLCSMIVALGVVLTLAFLPASYGKSVHGYRIKSFAIGPKS